MSNDYGKVTRKPSWLKIKLHENSEYAEVAALVKENNLHTICSSGKCPIKLNAGADAQQRL
jgi:lipoic acid synthetase